MQLIVIASIHQPSTSTFNLFDKLLLLSSGKTCYFGPVSNAKTYFGSIGHGIPDNTNPAEHLLDLTNVDFAQDHELAQQRLTSIQEAWTQHQSSHPAPQNLPPSKESTDLSKLQLRTNSQLNILLALLHRSFIKSYRDVVVYGIRVAMYIGLAIMMGVSYSLLPSSIAFKKPLLILKQIQTVWLRLPPTQSSIQPYINALFFGSAFMSFMAVAYVPAFLEDLSTFTKERANGLYGATVFLISNFLIGIPYLFLITLLFSIISYWLVNFRPTDEAFGYFVMWLFLDLIAAESLVVLMSSLFPNFVVSLALTAFANGLWMSVGGFLVTPTVLNVFWRYVFHYIDYQTYVFQGMMVNEFGSRSYSCGHGCNCMYKTELERQCRIQGTGVLDEYGYAKHRTGKWVGILIAIVVGYRIFGWMVLQFLRNK